MTASVATYLWRCHQLTTVLRHELARRAPLTEEERVVRYSLMQIAMVALSDGHDALQSFKRHIEMRDIFRSNTAVEKDLKEALAQVGKHSKTIAWARSQNSAHTDLEQLSASLARSGSGVSGSFWLHQGRPPEFGLALSAVATALWPDGVPTDDAEQTVFYDLGRASGALVGVQYSVVEAYNLLTGGSLRPR